MDGGSAAPQSAGRRAVAAVPASKAEDACVLFVLLSRRWRRAPCRRSGLRVVGEWRSDFGGWRSDFAGAVPQLDGGSSVGLDCSKRMETPAREWRRGECPVEPETAASAQGGRGRPRPDLEDKSSSARRRIHRPQGASTGGRGARYGRGRVHRGAPGCARARGGLESLPRRGARGLAAASGVGGECVEVHRPHGASTGGRGARRGHRRCGRGARGASTGRGSRPPGCARARGGLRSQPRRGARRLAATSGVGGECADERGVERRDGDQRQRA